MALYTCSGNMDLKLTCQHVRLLSDQFSYTMTAVCLKTNISPKDMYNYIYFPYMYNFLI